MFTLVEPIVLNDLMDRPFLGCAMVMGILQARDVPAKLVTGQTWVLSYLFGEGCDRFLDQVHWLAQGAETAPVLSRIREKPQDAVKEEMRELYEDIIPMTPRVYFNSDVLERVMSFLQAFRFIERYFATNADQPSPFIREFSERVLSTDPDIVGLSINLHMDAITGKIIKTLRDLSGAPIVLGGSCFARMREEDLRDYLRQWADYIVVGPAEESLADLLAAVESQAAIGSLPNVAFTEGGRPVINPCRPVEDLDALPFPDFSQYDLDKFLTPEPILPIQTSRGCAWGKCAFCQFPIGNLNRFQTLSVERVIAELNHQREIYGVNNFTFNDSDVTYPRIRRIAQAIVDRGLSGEFNFYLYSRFDSRFNDREVMALLKEAGVQSIHWGLESSNQRVLDLMKKGIDAADIAPILKKAAEAGIANQIFAFFGFPGETWEEAQETADFLVDHHAYIETSTLTVTGLFSLFPGTEIFNHPEDYAVDFLENGTYVITSGMTIEEAEAFRKRFNRLVNLGDLQLSAHQLKYVSMTNLSRMKFFLCAVHEQLMPGEGEALLADGRTDQVFPLVGGEIAESEMALIPVNFRESVAINQLGGAPPYPLSENTLAAVRLADGERRMDEILSLLARQLDAPSDVIREEVLGFLKRAFASGWALGFSKSWTRRTEGRDIEHKGES